MAKKIVLLGYMGCGKSAISRALSKKLNLPIVDLDDYIEAKENCTIKEVFENKGEVYFRQQEISCLKELLSNEKEMVLSVGGGTPCFGDNMNLINELGTAVYLSASIPTLVERLVKEKAKRPLIARIADDELAEFIGKHLFERRQFYLKAKIAVTVDKKSVTTIANEIIDLL
ncbi:AAA family ATPase [Flavobacteriaceae bacterium]|nr:AAA family ATPase [Flavobacteriaceae bacterium]